MGSNPPVEAFRLRGGTRVIIREAQAADAPALLAMHLRLSRRSLFMRYLDAFKRMTPTEARRACDPSDTTKVTLVAVLAEPDERLIALAMYALTDPQHPETAEAAILVEDAFQGCGLGRVMLERLTEIARRNGITTLTASVFCRNEQVTHFVRSSGLQIEQSMKGSVCEFTIHLNTDLGEREPQNEASG